MPVTNMSKSSGFLELMKGRSASLTLLQSYVTSWRPSNYSRDLVIPREMMCAEIQKQISTVENWIVVQRLKKCT